MGAGQMSAVTGMPKRNNYTDKINARAELLPQAYQINENKRINDANLALTKDQYDLQKKQMGIANKINYANLGLGAAGALGTYLDSNGSGAIDPVVNAVSSLGPGAPGSMAFDNGFNNVSNSGGILNSAVGLANDYLIDPAIEAVKWVGDAAGSLYDSAANAVTGFADDLFG